MHSYLSGYIYREREIFSSVFTLVIPGFEWLCLVLSWSAVAVWLCLVLSWAAVAVWLNMSKRKRIKDLDDYADHVVAEAREKDWVSRHTYLFLVLTQ